MPLPAEMIDHIFGFLRTDTSALNACLEALPHYARLAERHLYTHIIIKDDPKAHELDQQLSDNRILIHPRVFEIWTGHTFFSQLTMSPLLSIISMVPWMTNLKSLKLYGGFPPPFDFLSTIASHLQQSSIEHLDLSFFYDFPLSILDNGQNIKKLTMSNCTATEEPISTLSSPQLSLNTLVLRDDHNLGLRFGVLQRAANLTSLGLNRLRPDDELNWDPAEFLEACPKSLTHLYLDIEDLARSTYIYEADRRVGHWIDNGGELSFTLSALTRLKTLYISALIKSTETQINCALPTIIRLIKTAPSIQVIDLCFQCGVLDDIAFLGRLDWSLLRYLYSDSLSTCSRIGFCITREGPAGPSFSLEDFLRGFSGNEGLMDLVDRGLVVLKSEPTSWEGWTEPF